jgi:glycosyltransferase involved in cell wall biosynthesis
VRILIATSNRILVGGVEKYLQSVIPGLIDRGHSVGLLYEYPSNASKPGIDSQAGQVSSWCLQELGADALLRSLQAWAPDVVYSHGLDDSNLERRLLDSYPMALYAHTYYGTCVSGRKCHSWPRIQPCGRQFGAPCLALYYPRRCGGLNPQTMLQLFQLQSKRKSMLPDYPAVLVASRHMFREFEQHGVPPDRLHLVPLPAGTSSTLADDPKSCTGEHRLEEYRTGGASLPAAPEPRPRAPGYRILFIGRLMDVKGVNHLLEAIPIAAAKLGRDLTLTIAGDGPDRAQVEDSALRLGLPVEFAGWVDAERKSNLIRQADLVAVPSLWPEPFGLVGIEAGGFGVPAVGFAVGGIPDWLISGESGELAPGDPPTVEGLAEAIVRALADPEHHQRLSAGALAMVKRFTMERHIAQLEQILSVGTSAGRLIPSIV